ncbi:MAG: AHH domain-containing protein, partial [Brevundimonas sp.]|nr:AHH domain-containing protein [Brevundimonas sp.]
LRTTVSTGPENQSTTVVSDMTIGRPLSITDGLSRTVSYTYDGQQRVNQITRPAGDVVTLGYDARGNVTTTTWSPHGAESPIITSASYPANCTNPGFSRVNCNSPLRTTDARGAITTYAFDPEHGGLTQVTLPRPTPGAVQPQTRITYAPQTAWFRNASGTLAPAATSVTLPVQTSACITQASCANTADEVRSTVTYGSAGTENNLLPTSVTTQSGSGTVSSTSQFTYSVFGDVRTVDGPLPGGSDTTRFHYDDGRQSIGVVGPDPDGSGPLLNRAQRITYNPDGSVALVEVGATAGQGDPAWANFTSFQQTATIYDTYVRPTASRFTAGGTTYSVSQVSYDAAGRVQCVADRMNPALFSALPSSACVLGTEGSFGQDRIARLTYDAASQVLTTTSGFASADPLVESATYTVNGLVETLVDGNGNRSTMVYDGFDRLSRLLYPTASNGAVSNPADYQEYGYDPNGNVTSYRTRNNQTFATTYDALNRPTAIAQSGSVVNVGNQAFTYDLLGRPLSASVTAVAASSTPYTPYAPAAVTTMTWDALGRQLTETNTRDGSSLGTTTMTYDSVGRRMSMAWPGGFEVTYAYDTTDAMTQIIQAGSPYVTYGYDNLGRRTNITRPNGVNTTYGYDPASRLTSLAHAFTSGGSGGVSFAYTHNPAGQVLSVTPNTSTYDYPRPSSETTDYAVNGLNQTGVGFVFTHDAKGNLLGDGTRVYTYDQANRLRSSATGGTVNSTLSYDGLGRLGELTGTQGARYLYDGDEISGIIPNGSTSLINRIVRGPWPDEVVVSYPTNSTPLWLLQDHLGSTIAITDPSGNLITSLAYDEYGVPRSGNSGRFQYTGQLWLPDAQVYHYKARAYHPGFGRFLQTDPLGYAAGANLYGYVGGDPVNWTDPLGLDARRPRMICWEGSWENDGSPVSGEFEAPRCTNVITVTITAGGIPAGGIFGFGGGGIGSYFPGYGSEYGGGSIQSDPTYAAYNASRTRNMTKNAWMVDVALAPTLLIQAPFAMGGRAASVFTRACQCFEAGTEVWTENGVRNIEDLEVGDRVLARNDATGETTYRPIVELIRNQDRPIWEVTVELDDGSTEVIATTDEHPWRTTDGRWVETDDLSLGFELVTAEGLPVEVVSVMATDRLSDTYNFEVEGFHTYFVGEAGVWVHNACSRALSAALTRAGIVRPANSAAHHIVAGNARGAAAARATLSRFGIGIDSAANGIFLPAGQHAPLHTSAYYSAVNAALSGVASRAQAEAVLQGIGRALLTGSFP